MAAALALFAILQGCASYEGGPNAAWFPAAATTAEGRTPGRVAFMVAPQVRDSVAAVGASLKLQVGAIAEQATRTALGDGFEGGVQQVYGTPPRKGEHGATLVIDAVRFQHRERTVWYVWIPPLSQLMRYEASARLAFDVTLFDAQGGLVWTRTYDDDAGRLVWTTPSADSTPLPDDIGRVVHESAWRLAQRISQDVREWMHTELTRPRPLSLSRAGVFASGSNGLIADASRPSFLAVRLDGDVSESGQSPGCVKPIVASPTAGVRHELSCDRPFARTVSPPVRTA